MLASFGAELLKLRKRPATWVLATVLALGVIFFGYLLTYLVVSDPSQTGVPPGFKNSLLPTHMLPTVITMVAGLGGAIALIFGALTAGSEYGWSTLKSMLMQRPGRLGVFLGKTLAMATMLAVFALIALGAGAFGSYAVARLEDAAIAWPSAWDLVRGLGAAWLVLYVWASLGAFLAVLIRGTALPIGLGLVYALVLESLVATLPIHNETFKTATKALLRENSEALANNFGTLPPSTSHGALAEPAHAALALAAYSAVFFVVAALTFRRRNVP